MRMFGPHPDVTVRNDHQERPGFGNPPIGPEQAALEAMLAIFEPV